MRNLFQSEWKTEQYHQHVDIVRSEYEFECSRRNIQPNVHVIEKLIKGVTNVYKSQEEINGTKTISRQSFAIGRKKESADIDVKLSFRKLSLGDEQIQAICTFFAIPNVLNYCGVRLNWKTILLVKNQITDASTESLATLVDLFPTLQLMDLSQNSITESGARVIERAVIKRESPMILNVLKNDMDSRIAQQINVSASAPVNGISISKTYRSSMPNLKVESTVTEDSDDSSEYSSTPTTTSIDTSFDPVFFGKPIEFVPLTHSNRPIPVICSDLINLLRPRIGIEGIFRLSGDVHAMSSLKRQYDEGIMTEQLLSNMLNRKEIDIHSVAGVFKMYLRELPEPLFPSSLFEKFMSLTKLPQEEGIRVAQKTFAELPLVHAALADAVLRLLYDVSQKSETNMMTASNLGIVFGLNCFRSKESNPLTIAIDSVRLNKCLELLVTWYPSLSLQKYEKPSGNELFSVGPSFKRPRGPYGPNDDEIVSLEQVQQEIVQPEVNENHVSEGNVESVQESTHEDLHTESTAPDEVTEEEPQEVKRFSLRSASTTRKPQSRSEVIFVFPKFEIKQKAEEEEQPAQPTPPVELEKPLRVEVEPLKAESPEVISHENLHISLEEDTHEHVIHQVREHSPKFGDESFSQFYPRLANSSPQLSPKPRPTFREKLDKSKVNLVANSEQEIVGFSEDIIAAQNYILRESLSPNRKRHSGTTNPSEIFDAGAVFTAKIVDIAQQKGMDVNENMVQKSMGVERAILKAKRPSTAREKSMGNLSVVNSISRARIPSSSPVVSSPATPKSGSQSTTPKSGARPSSASATRKVIAPTKPVMRSPPSKGHSPSKPVQGPHSMKMRDVHYSVYRHQPNVAFESQYVTKSPKELKREVLKYTAISKTPKEKVISQLELDDLKKHLMRTLGINTMWKLGSKQNVKKFMEPKTEKRVDIAFTENNERLQQIRGEINATHAKAEETKKDLELFDKIVSDVSATRLSNALLSKYESAKGSKQEVFQFKELLSACDVLHEIDPNEPAISDLLSKHELLRTTIYESNAIKRKMTARFKRFEKMNKS